MTLRRTSLRRSGGPRRHQGLRQRSRKQARRDRVFQAAKLLVLERDGYECRMCHGLYSRYAFDVHHLLMRSQGGTDEPENLVTLCRECHTQVHEFPELSYKLGWLVRSGGGA